MNDGSGSIPGFKNVVIHKGIPDRLKPDEKPDLGAVRIVSWCGKEGDTFCLSWSRVNCPECIRMKDMPPAD